MLYYIKKYPLSLFVVISIVYLSFFRPPSIDTTTEIPHLDKIIHFCMYFVMSGILWLEFIRTHKNNGIIWHAWRGAFVAPILFSGAIELLQEYCTTYRGGDILDFIANTLGVTIASIIGYSYLRRKIKATSKVCDL